MNMKCKATTITLNRLDGKQETYITTSETPFAEANQTLQKWAETAPKKEPYHNVEFTVKYEDQAVYKGNCLLKYRDIYFDTIIEHQMTGHLEWYAGLAKNPDKGMEEYLKELAEPEFQEKMESHKLFLASHYIGDGISQEVIENRKVNYELNLKLLTNKITQYEEKLPQMEAAVLNNMLKIEYTTGYVEGVRTVQMFIRSNRASEIEDYLDKQLLICTRIEKEEQESDNVVQRSAAEHMIDIVCTPNKTLKYFQGRLKGGVDATDLLTKIQTKKYKIKKPTAND